MLRSLLLLIKVVHLARYAAALYGAALGARYLMHNQVMPRLSPLAVNVVGLSGAAIAIGWFGYHLAWAPIRARWRRRMPAPLEGELLLPERPRRGVLPARNL